MKLLKIILLSIYILFNCGNALAQENKPERTPEQEATLQTEKIQQELNLTSEQIQRIHEINLKYARERQVSNSRIEALQRIKKKEQDLRRVLNPEQYNQLQNKQYERSATNPTIRRTTPASTSTLRNENEQPAYRTVPRIQTPANSESQTNRRPSTTERSPKPTQPYSTPGERSTNSSTERNSGVRSTVPDTHPTRSQGPTNAPTRKPEPASTPTRSSEKYTVPTGGSSRSSERTTQRPTNTQTPPSRSGSSNSERR